MKIFGAAAVLALPLAALLSGPVAAQAPNINLLPELESKTPEQKEAEARREKAYKESLRKIPDAKGAADPWGSVRTAEPPKPPPAKPKTKTGSNAQ